MTPGIYSGQDFCITQEQELTSNYQGSLQASHGLVQNCKRTRIIFFYCKSMYKLFRIKWQVSVHHFTEVRFDSFLSGGFTTMVVINPLDWKLANRTSVHLVVDKRKIALSSSIWWNNEYIFWQGGISWRWSHFVLSKLLIYIVTSLFKLSGLSDMKLHFLRTIGQQSLGTFFVHQVLG